MKLLFRRGRPPRSTPARPPIPTSRTREEHLAWASWLADLVEAPLSPTLEEGRTLRSEIEALGWSFGDGLTSWTRFVEAWEVGIEHVHDILRVHGVPWEDPWAREAAVSPPVPRRLAADIPADAPRGSWCPESAVGHWHCRCALPLREPDEWACFLCRTRKPDRDDSMRAEP